MNDRDLLLLKLINESKTCNEICKIMRINYSQLYKKIFKLQYEGYEFIKNVYSDGNIKYSLAKNIKNLKRLARNENEIKTSKDENDIKILVISDLHLGNTYERIDMLDEAYNHCIKEGIHIIFCCGDLIDGTYSQTKQHITNCEEQIEYFSQKYPYDKSIATIAVAGDHDASCLNKYNLCMIELLKKLRNDIIIGGYNSSKVIIKNDFITLNHFIEGETGSGPASIRLFGHYHIYKSKFTKNNCLQVLVPTLSDLTDTFPSALELNIHFEKKLICDVDLKHIYFENGTKTLSDNQFTLINNKKFLETDELEIPVDENNKTLKKIIQ